METSSWETVEVRFKFGDNISDNSQHGLIDPLYINYMMNNQTCENYNWQAYFKVLFDT